MKSKSSSKSPPKAPGKKAKTADPKTSKPPILDLRLASQKDLEKVLTGKTKPANGKAAAQSHASVAKPSKSEGQMSALDAAAKVLGETAAPMRCVEIVKVMLDKKYWSTAGRTPAATLYSALLREIDAKPGESRFAKTGKGLFALAKKA